MKNISIYITLIIALLAASLGCGVMGAANVPQPDIAAQVSAMSRAVNGLAPEDVMVFTNDTGSYISVWRTRGGFIVNDLTGHLLRGGGQKISLEDICDHLSNWRSIPASELPADIAAKITAAAKAVEAVSGTAGIGSYVSGLMGTIWYPCYDCLPNTPKEEDL